ncbi:C2H2-type zinc finger transcription factor [Phycomyces blakesleeanus NRRL 1555(-)]|uniref:C2H2-type zinc finger transcription factor n=1 Tax=Phycomyces blakesleeanus (strain ATCC 8743b / DSM 1359 / FGSC 10004 / NBRC 33097 / NRRL 1555) TaxID=763407 RepID=A0A163AC90_PHYB8|nr:C2H2-type zinc finger transcription factor [Phycomyces blakesleeanus NRRL 1555(-)]OAD72511.1 C2H2-type zinc finger transcription factor [Phycomyces blakesleeanus NRRL 1555(-)]|eukprot:XP_018290551.1 C2H2-type zinc finger transcription factor [Phycomyces blakesleeanus NRRL 1555(-)]
MSFDSRLLFCQGESEDQLPGFLVQNEDTDTAEYSGRINTVTEATILSQENIILQPNDPLQNQEDLTQQNLTHTLPSGQLQNNLSELLAYIPAAIILQGPLQTSVYGSLSVQPLNNSFTASPQGYSGNDYQPRASKQQQEYDLSKSVFIHYNPNGPSSRDTRSLDPSSVKSYSCLECSYKTNKIFNLKRHLNVHLGNRYGYGCYYSTNTYHTISNTSKVYTISLPEIFVIILGENWHLSNMIGLEAKIL